MVLTLKDELRRTFELATLRQEAKTLGTSRNWAQANDVMSRSRVLRDREDRLFAERYDTRVDIARRRLVGSAAAPARDLKPSWAGLDRFDPADLLRQARREVRANHEGRISRIKEAEARALAGLVRNAARENELQGMGKTEFERVAGPNPDIKQRRITGPRQE